MSLQLWLPFNGSVENKGLLNPTITNSGAIFGGLGKTSVECLKSSAKVSYDVSEAKISTHQMSFSFWARSDYYSGTSTQWWKLCTFLCTDNSDFHVYCVPNARYKIEYNPELNAMCDTSVWHHLTYVLNGTKLTIYLDGVPINGAPHTVTNANRFLKSVSIGTSQICINDFRLYDHCLTIQEIERDYSSLLIHYPLRDREVEATTNLLSNGRFDGYGGLTINISSYAYSDDNVCTLTTASATATTGSARAYIPLSQLTDNTSYSLSYKWKLVSGQGNLKPGDWCDGAVQIKKNDFNGEYYEVEVFLPARSTYTSVYRFLDFNNIGSSSVYEIWDVQLERKDYCTPFTLGSRSGDPVYDCSGRNYDSATHDTLTVTSNSARNGYSTHFTAGNAIQVPSPYSSGNLITEFSLFMWVYLDTDNNYMYLFSTNHGTPTGSNAGWFSVNCENYKLWFYSNTTYWNNGEKTKVPTNEWHHVGMTFKEGVVQFYYDGKPSGSPSVNSKTGIQANTFFSIGDSYTGTSWGGTPFNGSISDFRFYGLALTDSMVADLYNNSATIDKNGNMYAFEYVEE